MLAGTWIILNLCYWDNILASQSGRVHVNLDHFLQAELTKLQQLHDQLLIIVTINKCWRATCFDIIIFGLFVKYDNNYQRNPNPQLTMLHGNYLIIIKFLLLAIQSFFKQYTSTCWAVASLHKKINLQFKWHIQDSVFFLTSVRPSTPTILLPFGSHQ